MTKAIAIIAGEPNSISSEIIFKCWQKKKAFKHLPCLLIGNFNLLNKQLIYFEYNLKFHHNDLANPLKITHLNDSSLYRKHTH